MTIGLATRGYYGGGGTVGTSAPEISNITPDPGIPGGAGSFSLDYSTARMTPIEFDLTHIVEGAGITISVKYAHRNETYVALGHDGEWRWPFDVYSSIGSLAVEPVHVSLLPRDGWPPVGLEIQVAAVRRAVESP